MEGTDSITASRSISTPALSNPRIPLLREEERENYENWTHTESIYSVLLLLPPFWLAKYGDRINIKVPLALLLCLLSVLIQTYLTSMTGLYLYNNDIEFQDSLLEDSSGSKFSPAYMYFLEYYLPGEAKRITEAYEIWHDKKSERKYGCCSHVGCAGGKQPCCAPLAEAGANRSTGSFWQAAKPGGGGKSPTSNSGRDSRPQSLEEEEATFQRSAMCHLEDKLSCTQPTFGYVDLWDELDVDGNGAWTLQEAQADRTNLACRTGLSPEEVFRSVCRGIRRMMMFHPRGDAHRYSKDHQFLPAAVEKREFVPRDYFNWWRHLAVICSVDDVARCQGLIKQGVFDGWMRAPDQNNGAPRGIDAALDYCQRLLAPNGWCDKTLPATFMMYRDRAKEKCGESVHQMGPGYVNPYNPKDISNSMVEVHYAHVDTFLRVTSPGFLIFLFLVLFLWWATLTGEFDSCMRLFEFLWHFPTSEDDGFGRWDSAYSFFRLGASTPLSAREDSIGISSAFLESQEYQDRKHHVRIYSFTKTHKITCWIMAFTRLYLCWLLAYMGSLFLTKNYTYIDLLTNAVALGFVFEVPELIYHFLVEKDVKYLLAHELAPLRYTSSRSTWSQRMQVACSKFFWGLVLLPIACGITLAYTYFLKFVPILEALTCICHQRGTGCAAAPYFARDWWDAYWGQNFNSIIH